MRLPWVDVYQFSNGFRVHILAPGRGSVNIADSFQDSLPLLLFLSALRDLLFKLFSHTVRPPTLPHSPLPVSYESLDCGDGCTAVTRR